MSAPSTFISPAQTRVLLALLRVYERDGRATVRSVAAEAGLASYGRVQETHLSRLADAGLIAWEPGKAGTLRPLVGVVAATPEAVAS